MGIDALLITSPDRDGPEQVVRVMHRGAGTSTRYGTLADVGDVDTSGADDAFHRPRHRRLDSSHRRFDLGAQAWRPLAYIGAALAALVIAVLFASAVHDSTQPRVSGTYTEETCEGGGRYGCESVGTWTSDDGESTYRGVALDGSVGTDGTSRSYAIPNALFGGTEIVHDSTISPLLGIVGPAVLFGMLALVVLRAADRWGDLDRVKKSWKHRRASKT